MAPHSGNCGLDCISGILRPNCLRLKTAAFKGFFFFFFNAADNIFPPTSSGCNLGMDRAFNLHRPLGSTNLLVGVLSVDL